MAIKNLGDKVSAEDVEKTREKRNPPEYDPEFSPGDSDGGGDDWGNIFDDQDLGDFLGGDTSGPSSGSSGGFSSGFSGASTGLQTMATDPFGGGGLASTFGSPFGAPIGGPMQQAQQPATPPKPDAFDKVLDMSENAIIAIGKIFVSMWNSFKTRTADDWGYYSRNAAITSAGLGGMGVILFIVGLASGLPQLSFTRIPIQFTLAAMFTLGSSIIGISVAAISVTLKAPSAQPSMQDIADVEEPMEFEESSSVDDSLTELLSDMFGDEDEDEEADIFEEPEPEPIPEPPKVVDINERVKNIQSNVPILSREVLINAFKPVFPCNTPGFAVKERIQEDSEKFMYLETLCLKALAAAGKIEQEEVNSKLESAYESYYTYELKLKRIKNMNKLDDIEREMKAYFRESSDDESVSCKVDLEGDFYRVVLNKGESAVVTFGDVFQLQSVVNFFLDIKNQLPIIAGITEDGQPLLIDAKNFDTMLIAGRPRSGKSWYVLSLLLAMMLFNSPEVVQFLILDPKESNLFKTLALMPHVCGLHNDKDILNILSELIDGEGSRRKKLLADNRCENIWDLRRKGIELPVLYVVIDEYMTVLANLSNEGQKDFQEKVKVIISQLPSLGIRLIFVPHRSQGVVDKTARVNIAFTAAVRAETQVILETLDIKKWTTPLLNQGDIALKMQGIGKEQLVRGLAVTPSDGENTDLIMGCARAFYKMGCSLPDMTSIGRGYNRDMDYIKQELNHGDGASSRVQFDEDDGRSLDELQAEDI